MAMNSASSATAIAGDGMKRRNRVMAFTTRAVPRGFGT
jgi:hypothetical protein